MKKIFIFFCKFTVFPFLRFFLKEVKGKDNIPFKNNFILVSNHIDGVDHWFLLLLLQERMEKLHFIGAMDSVKIFFQSALLYYLSDTIVINRKNIKRKDLVERVMGYLKKGEIIIIYPEGGTNKEATLLKGKTGMAEIAIKSGLPIVPVGILREENSRKRIIKIGEPLFFKKSSQSNMRYELLLREVTDRLMRAISKLCGKPYLY
ncbi:MAG: hypothetical protein COS98_02400 [Parcubacteria group bacterium CG07_land_8_20_14_0_80_35_11]|nr:MAG: hypothetical protein COS98_02400 [Parcubacteria group bacterium CG07_land_8_20_14_0_80_35_11]